MGRIEADENDFAELLYYVIGLLEEIGADQVIEQIKGLESFSVIEEPNTKEKKRTSDSSGQMNKFDIEIQEQSSYDSEKAKQKDSDIGCYITRQMTFREMFMETMNILDTYLVSVPAIAVRTKELLEQTSSELIQWKNEGKNRIDKEMSGDSLSSVDLIESQNQEEIRALLKAINMELGLREEYEKKR